MVTCPSCGASVPSSLEFCGSCLGALSSEPRPRAADETREAVESVPPDAAAVALLAPVASTEPPEEQSARCPRHSGLPVAGTCGRCGTFYCLECVPNAARKTPALCPDCEASREVREAPERINDIYQELSGSLVVIAVLMVAFRLVTMLLFETPPFLLVLLDGLLLALPFAASAALIWTRRMWAVWLGFALETAVLGVLLLTSFGFNLPTGLALLIIPRTLSLISKLRRLLKLQAGSQVPVAAG